MFCKYAPDASRIYFGSIAVDVWNAELRKADPLTVEHAEYVVVGCDQQICRIRKRFVVCKPARIDMPLRADYG